MLILVAGFRFKYLVLAYFSNGSCAPCVLVARDTHPDMTGAALWGWIKICQPWDRFGR